MDWVGQGINYGEALVKGLWEYFRLSDYFHVQFKNLKGQQRKFDDVKNYWDSVIEQSYLHNRNRRQRRLNVGDSVQLENFTITEWFPWLPGRYWTEWGATLRYMSHGYIMKKKPTKLKRYDGNILRPHGKTLSVVSGIGAVRMREHTVEQTKFKVVSATTINDASSAIPILMTEKAYRKIRKIVETIGSVNATIQGVYSEMPASLDYLLNISLGIPRTCIYVGSQLLVKDEQQGNDVHVPAWSIYDGKKENDINLAYCYFDVKDTDGPASAGEFLADYIDNYKGTPITDFDEKVSRLEATVPITQVTKENIDLTKLRKLVQRIRHLYHSRI